MSDFQRNSWNSVLGSAASQTPLYGVAVTESNEPAHDFLLQFDCPTEHPLL
jgi:hypothetical protein